MEGNYSFRSYAPLFLAMMVVSMGFRPAASLPREFQDISGENPSLNEFELSLDAKSPVSDSIPSNTSVCFPYFISMDIEGLLAQASRMLHKGTNPRQKSWLQLFVAQLESLSKQLKNLPAENKNMCFLKRQKFLTESKQRVNSTGMSPEDQLRFAKEVFASPVETTEPLVRNQQPEALQAVNSDQLMVSDEVLSSRRDEHLDKQETKVKTMAVSNHDGIPRTEIQPKISSDLRLPILSGAEEKIPELSPTTSPTGRPQVSNMYYESVPFLPRSTRKIAPLNILRRYKKPISLLGLKHYLLSNSRPMANDRSHAESRIDPLTDEVIVEDRIQNDGSLKNSVHTDFLSPNLDMIPDHLDEQMVSKNPGSTEPVVSSYDDAVVQLHDNELASASATENHNPEQELLHTRNLNSSDVEHKPQLVSEEGNGISKSTIVNPKLEHVLSSGSDSDRLRPTEEWTTPAGENPAAASNYLPLPLAVREKAVRELHGKDTTAAQQLEALKERHERSVH